jgi:hypothetical protein
VTLSFETNVANRQNPNPEPGGASINERKIVSGAVSGPPAALKLSARVNVMDVIADALAIKGSLLRCAQVAFTHLPSLMLLLPPSLFSQVYERHCAEDAAAAAEEMRSEGEEEEEREEDVLPEDEETRQYSNRNAEEEGGQEGGDAAGAEEGSGGGEESNLRRDESDAVRF